PSSAAPTGLTSRRPGRARKSAYTGVKPSSSGGPATKCMPSSASRSAASGSRGFATITTRRRSSPRYVASSAYRFARTATAPLRSSEAPKRGPEWTPAPRQSAGDVSEHDNHDERQEEQQDRRPV